jgi:ABC-2 type transport system ATP-binding protein
MNRAESGPPVSLLLGEDPVTPITIEQLSKIYRKGLRQQKVVAVNDLSLSVADGEIFGFIGPNGAGKSTTIKILCDLIRPTTGRAAIMGIDVQKPEARRQIGYLPENPSYYAYLSAWELLRFHGAIHGVSDDVLSERADKLLEMLDLTDAAHRPLRTYSKGMVQRAGIAAALIHDPVVLIFDEPMSGLDPIGRKLVGDLMVRLRHQGKTIFFSTHILADVETICDRVGVIVEGTLVYEGSMETVRSSAIRYYDLVFSADASKVNSISWPNQAVPRKQADLFILEVKPDDFVSAIKLILDQGFELTRIEPRRQRLEELFVTLARNG